MGVRPASSQRCFSFGDDFELDLRAYELRSKGIRLKLKPISMELLILLVERNGELVLRDQIVEHVWGKGNLVDTDNNINGAISRIRHALRDDPERPRFVLTIPGKGYRFIAPVTANDPQTRVAEPAQEATEETTRAKQQTRKGRTAPLVPARPVARPRLRRRLTLAVVSTVLIVTLGALAIRLLPSRRQRATPADKRIMLAVLPFQNLTGDTGQEYFSDGLTEEMITQLGNIDPRHLGVIARTSVMHYKNSLTPLD